VKSKVYYYIEYVQGDYNDPGYHVYYSVEDKYHAYFIYKCKSDKIDIEPIEECDVFFDEVVVFEPDRINERVSMSPSDILVSLSEKYGVFVDQWAASGQNPDEWGVSVGMIHGGNKLEIDKVKAKLPLKEYQDARFQNELDEREDVNYKIDKQKELYKHFGIKHEK